MPLKSVKKNGIKRKTQRFGQRFKQPRKQIRLRSHGDRVLAPGVGAAVAKPFNPGGERTGGVNSLECWDAKLPNHLPLPRAVGPYCVVRTTKRFRTNRANVIIGTFTTEKLLTTAGPSSSTWSNVCAVACVNCSNPINSASNAEFWSHDLQGFGKAATIAPSAISVQVMNPNPLQTTCGMIYGAVMTTQADIGGDQRTCDNFSQDFVQYMGPRLMAAPKLALRGVQANSYPLNMSILADFMLASDDVQGNTVGDWVNNTQPRGFAPIMVYNPACSATEPGPELEYLITTEWRVRFDVTNPASAAHTQHRPTSEAKWSSMVSNAIKLGNGFIDIADRVANIGSRVGPLLF
jgi:hypothetical protein